MKLADSNEDYKEREKRNSKLGRNYGSHWRKVRKDGLMRIRWEAKEEQWGKDVAKERKKIERGKENYKDKK